MSNIIDYYFQIQLGGNEYNISSDFQPPAYANEIEEVEKKLAIKFPQGYVDFLRITNGYSGKIGLSFSVFIGVDKIEEYTKNYGGDFFPWIIFIGTDGGNEMYVIDRRTEHLQFGILPYVGQESDFIALGNTFEDFIGHLYRNDFWNV